MKITIRPMRRTQLDTDYANTGLDRLDEVRDAAPFVYQGIETEVELNGARWSESAAEDRALMRLTGALPSEVWS